MLEAVSFAGVLVAVLPTIGYRGWIAVVELVARGAVAAIAVAGAVGLWNNTPGATRLASVAVILTVCRVLLSLYWTTLPGSAAPGERLLIGVAAVVAGLVALVVIRRAPASR